MSLLDFFGKKNAIGIYVDDKAVYVARAERKLRRAQIVGAAESRIVSQDTAEGTDKNKQILKAVGLAFQAAGAHSKHVHLAISGEESMLRCFDLPMIPRRERRNAVRYEAQKYLPFDVKDLYFDFEDFADEAQKKIHVVFSAVKKEVVDRLLMLLQRGGITVDAVELVSHSIARKFVHDQGSELNMVYALIQANNEKTAEVIIGKNHSVLTTRHAALSRISDSTEPDLPFLISEIRLSIDYFSRNFKGQAVGKISLFADDLERLKGFDEALKQEFGLPVEIVRPADTDPSAVSSRAPGIRVAAGLALRGLLGGKKERINLRSLDYVDPFVTAVALPWPEERKLLIDLAIKEAMGLSVALFLLFFFLSGTVSARKTELDRLIDSYPKSASVNMTTPIAQLRDREQMLGQRIGVLSKLIDRRVFFTSKMNEIAGVIPENIRLMRLGYSDDIESDGSSRLSVRIEGSVVASGEDNELSVVNNLATHFSNNGEFMKGLDEIKVSSVKKSFDRNVMTTQFVLECVS